MKTFLLWCTLVSLASCNFLDSRKTKKITIGFSQCTIQDDWRKMMVQEMKREIGFHPEYEINLIITDAGNSSKTQIGDVKQLMNAGIDLLIISPNEAAPLTTIVEHVYDQGIPVIIIDRRINSSKFTSYIGGDNFGIGKQAGLFAKQLMDGKGKILEITGLAGSTPARERADGFLEGIKEFLQLKVVKTVNGDWSRESSQSITDTLLNSWTDFDLIYAHNDQMAYGAFLSARKHNIKPYIIGVDGLYTQANGVDMVANGSIDGTFLYPTGGDKAIDLALKILRGESFSKFNYLETYKIDENNARVYKLQNAQLTNQANKIDLQRKEIGEMAFLLKKKETFFILLIIISALLFLSAGILGYFIHHKNKVNRTLDLKGKTIQDNTKLITEQRDGLITALRVTEEATESKIRFFVNVSHEIKTVLSLISIHNHKPSSDNGTIQKEKIELFDISINRLLSLSNEIVNFRQSSYTLKTQTSDLALCLNGIVKVFEETAIEKGIILISEFPPRVDATFDPSVVEKVMFNLISNAIKYTHKGGEVKIRAIVTEDLINISVHDTGVGIPEEELPFIFERFYRGRIVRQNNGESGNGVGLDFTKELIQLHQGNIEVNSKVNGGSIFLVSLPQKHVSLTGADHNPVLHEDVENTLITADKKIRVLVVEDNYELRKYMINILSKHFVVIAAENGVKGFEQAKSFHPDIVISDILMPEKDGIELCQDLKNDPSTFLIPVILLTAMDTETSFIRSFDTGADAFLSKPFKEKVLFSRINSLVQTRMKLKEEYGKPVFQMVEQKSKKRHDEDFLKNCHAEIYKKIGDPNFTLDCLARGMGMSRSSLYRKIKETTGLKAVDFLRTAKLQYAAKLLMKSDMTVNEIAWESGFSDVKHFSKIFAKEFGKLPSKYHG